MTRRQYHSIITRAHELIHEGCFEAAHEILHDGLVHPGSMTCDPEVQKAVESFLVYQEGKIPCGHTIGDLIGGKGSVTKCGACLAERQPRSRVFNWELDIWEDKTS